MISKTNISYEEKLLFDLDQYIFEYISSKYKDNDSFQNARFNLLEVISSRLGGFCYQSYCDEIICETPLESISDELIDHICTKINTLPFHYSMALASLSKVKTNPFDQRTSGSYYTDFRLANYVSSKINDIVPKSNHMKIIDPASGSGILLVAAALKLSEKTKIPIEKVLEHSIYASDLSPYAIRACLLVLSSLTDSIESLKSLKKHLRVGDSLIEKNALWKDVCPDGFDIVIGNPPWEKLKVSLHEYLLSQGHDRHYGATTDNHHKTQVDDLKITLKQYTDDLRKLYKLQSAGELDLYKLFLELAYQLTNQKNSQLLLIVPAGLIRSLNTEKLREYLFKHAKVFDITLLFNRARFFAIDTRTKFLVLNVQFKSTGSTKPLRLIHADANEIKVIETSHVNIDRKELSTQFKTLLIPEVRDQVEWNLFYKMVSRGLSLNDKKSIYFPTFLREVDMTNDKKHFVGSPSDDKVPVIEGRMVHQFTCMAKAYISGTGRKATWTSKQENKHLAPQYWIPTKYIKQNPKLRMNKQRIGFCDISGQTNERTMLASLIPQNSICGNKVPTIIFEHVSSDLYEDINYLWLAIANSFCFDWMLRRMASTTINFFILKELSFPDITISSEIALKIITASKKLHSTKDLWEKANRRAELDCLVLDAYNLSIRDIEVILQDFSLLDRKQPPINGEARSTITKDFLLLEVSKVFNEKSYAFLSDRVKKAKKLGAVPYLPTEMC